MGAPGAWLTGSRWGSLAILLPMGILVWLDGRRVSGGVLADAAENHPNNQRDEGQAREGTMIMRTKTNPHLDGIQEDPRGATGNPLGATTPAFADSATPSGFFHRRRVTCGTAKSSRR